MAASKELRDLLAPVPLIHLLSAIESGMTREVAFGSENVQLFSKLGADVTIGMRVWIYASRTGSEGLDPMRSQRVCFAGDFGGSTETVLSYPDLWKVRPPSAETDTSWIVLWSVKNLQVIDPPRLVSTFNSAVTGKSLAKAPEGPILIYPPAA